MIAWILKRLHKTFPGTIFIWATEVTHALGERYIEPVVDRHRKETAPLPRIRPLCGRIYEDDCIHIVKGDDRTLRISWHDAEVFKWDNRKGLMRFNYSDEWVRHLWRTQREIKSKERRAKRARFRDLDNDGNFT